MKLTDSELDTLADAIATDVEISAANPSEGVGDFATCATVTAVESLMAARVRDIADEIEPYRDGAEAAALIRDRASVDADVYRYKASRITERMAVAECRIAEVKAICFAADDPGSERYTSDQDGLVHLIADIREAIGI